MLRVGTMQTLLVLCYCLFSSPLFWTGETAVTSAITVSEITVCSLAIHFLPGGHGGAKLLTVQFLMFLTVQFLMFLSIPFL